MASTADRGTPHCSILERILFLGVPTSRIDEGGMPVEAKEINRSVLGGN